MSCPSCSCLPGARFSRSSGFGLGFACVLLLCVTPSMTACSREKAEPLANTSPQSAPVQVAPVEQRDLPIEVTAIGSVEASSTVAIMPQVSGRITKVEFEEGAFVNRNDPLFTIDTRPYNASLSAAQAELARSEAAAEQAKAEAERYEALARQGLASSQEVLQRLADLKSSHAAIQSARAAISAATLNVQFTTLRAPIDGRTGQLLVTAGNIVQPGGTDPLVVIRSLSPVKVNFNVPPTLLPQLRQNGRVLPLEVRATTRGSRAVQAKGQLTFVDNTVDPLSGSLTLKATFDNTQEALWPGDFVDVIVVVGTDEQAVVAPESAIAMGQQGAYAFVVDANNIAHFRTVEVRRRTLEYVVVEQGLSPGEHVVTNGLLRLRDKSPVTPQAQPVAAPATTNAAGEEP